MGVGEDTRSAAPRRLDAVVFVLRSRNLRRLHLGRLVWQSAELAHVVALLVFAYDRGGASEVAVFGVVRTVAAAASVPFVAVLGDRFPRVAVLTGAAALGAASLAAASVTAATEATSLLVYAASAVAAVAMAVYRPTSSALVPSLVQRPTELVAHNLVGTVVEGATALAGPVLGTLLVNHLGVPGALSATSAALLAVVAMFGSLRRSIGGAAPRVVTPATSIGRDLTAGFRQLASADTSRLLAMLGSAQTLVRGALTVLVVVLAVDLLDMRESGTGMLLAAIGVGSLVGALVTARFVSGDRLGRMLALGLTLWGAPIIAVAFAPVPVVAGVVLAVIGLGNNLVDVSLFTILQRSVPNEVMARVMGALETALQAAMALGALLAAAALAALGDRGALIAVGALLPAVAALALPALARLDRQSQVRDIDVALLQGDPLFAPLPLVEVELLAARLSPATTWSPGDDVVHSGDEGDRYYVIEHGEAEVVVHGTVDAVLGPGDGFGEIALLRDVPRIATVRARTVLRLRALEREDFLTVVTGHPGSHAAARDVVEGRLVRRPVDLG